MSKYVLIRVTGQVLSTRPYSFVAFVQEFGHYRFNPKSMECDMGADFPSIKARMILLLIEAAIPVLLILVLYIFIFIMVSSKQHY